MSANKISRNNRSYKKGGPFRNSSLFLIACEGAVTEKDYFNYFSGISRRIQVKVLSTELGRSSPSSVRERALRYIEEKSFTDEDQLWFVVDVDRWKQDTLRDIAEECNITPNWHIAISNPCFEVWLFLHKLEITSVKGNSCKEYKKELPKQIQGGYNLPDFIIDLHYAVSRAKANDTNPDYFMPDKPGTKVYQLIEAIFEALGPSEVQRYFGHPISEYGL